MIEWTLMNNVMRIKIILCGLICPANKLALEFKKMKTNC